MKMKLIVPALLALRSLVLADGVADEDYVVHEWGTFTSVQGADGIQLEWNPLLKTELPSLFYSEQERTVDGTVRFPAGRITEWFPQARDIGPSFVQPRPILSKLDGLANKAGLPGVNLSAIDTQKGITNSLIRWTDIKVLPAKTNDRLKALVPSDTSGSHYYAARETD